MLGAPGLPRAHSHSPHALTLHTHTRSPSHIAQYMHILRMPRVDQTNKLAEQPMRHPPKRCGERRGHSIREGDGRELELGRGRGGGRRRGALPAGHVGGVAHAAPPPQHGLGKAAADGMTNGHAELVKNRNGSENFSFSFLLKPF